MKDRIKSIDSIRFILCIFILYFHILHPNIINYTGGSKIYLKLQEMSTYTGTIVECFFIISGFFLYKTIIAKRDLNVSQYIADRFMRLWPVYFFSILICVLFFHQGFYSAIFQSFMLHCTGISLEWKGINWYITPLFWSSIFLFAIIRSMKQEKANLLIVVLVFFSYAININYTGGGFGRDTIYNFLNLGMIRALAGVGMGFLLGLGLDKFPNYRKGFLSCFIFTIAEIASSVLLAITWFYKPLAYKNLFIVVIAFLILFICVYLGNGLITRFLDNKMLAQGGKYAYSIYVMQQITFYILQKTFWNNTIFVQYHYCVTIIISIAICVIAGIIVYYLVERPAIRFYKRKYKINKN